MRNKSHVKSGIIKRYLVDRGYGFISAEGDEYFIHVTSINLPKKYRVLLQGEEVEFTPQIKNNKLCASKVTPKLKHEKDRMDLLSECQGKIESYRITSNKKFLPEFETILDRDIDREEIVNFGEYLENCYSPKNGCFIIRKNDGSTIAFSDCNISPDQMKEIVLQYICGQPKRSVEYDDEKGTVRFEEEGIPPKPFYKDNMFWTIIGLSIITCSTVGIAALALSSGGDGDA